MSIENNMFDFWMQAKETKENPEEFEDLTLQLTITAADGQTLTKDIRITKNVKLYRVNLAEMGAEVNAKRIKNIVLKASRKTANSVRRAQFSLWLAEKLNIPVS